MQIFILITTDQSDDPILGAYDSELLAEKRKLYFETIYSKSSLKIIEKNMEYIDRE